MHGPCSSAQVQIAPCLSHSLPGPCLSHLSPPSELRLEYVVHPRQHSIFLYPLSTFENHFRPNPYWKVAHDNGGCFYAPSAWRDINSEFILGRWTIAFFLFTSTSVKRQRLQQSARYNWTRELSGKVGT